MRALLVGVAAFSLGSMSSARAVNENETLSLLCSRFSDGTGGAKLEVGMGRLRAKKADAAETALVAALVSMRDMVCVTSHRR